MSDSIEVHSALSESPRQTVVHHCDRFVARTMNWLYDHLRYLNRTYEPLVVSKSLENRDEFPEIEAEEIDSSALSRRLWGKLTSGAPFPRDVWRITDREPVLWHSHFGYVAVEAHRWLDRIDVPWVVSFYGADVYQLGREESWKDRYARVFDRSVRILALGPVMRDTLIAMGAEPEKVEVHPLGVDISSLPSKVRVYDGSTPLRVLFAGTFREKKGIEELVRAVAMARERGVDIELHLVGDAHGKPGDRETKNRVFELIGSLGLENKVEHHSWLSFRDLLNVALECHVFAHPSVTASDGDAEGTPFVIQQMMATGMPVISTRHSDIPLLFGEHRELLVPEHDSEAIADQLQLYWEQPERVSDIGRLLQERIVEKLDVRDRAAELAGIYDRILR